MKTLIVTSSGCPNCSTLKDQLRRDGIEFEEVKSTEIAARDDFDEIFDAMEKFKAFPLVKAPDGEWSNTYKGK